MEDNENNNEFFYEKELLNRCKNINKKNKKSKFHESYKKKKSKDFEIENKKKRNNFIFFEFLSKIKYNIKSTTLIICIIILLTTLYNVSIIYIDAFLCFPIKRFNIQIANYTITSNNLFMLDILKLESTTLAYIFRKNLLNKYKHIYKTNNTDSYNVIGIFEDIRNDFAFLSSSNNNYIRYINYKKEYLLELEKILHEYTIRNSSSDKFLYSKKIFRGGEAHIIPNRIILYTSLAHSYYIAADLENLEINQENLKKLKDILYGYDTVLNQETSKESYHLPFNYDDKQIYDTFYYIFTYLYAKKIILMEEKLNPQTFCENKELFNKYLTVSKNLNNDTDSDKKANFLITNKCNYKI